MKSASAFLENLVSPQDDSQQKESLAVRTSSHDQFFKYAFSIPGVINRFLEWTLSREMLEQIDLSG